MSTQHDLGDIDIVIPADNFQGGYATMAEGLNKWSWAIFSVKHREMAMPQAVWRATVRGRTGEVPGQEGIHQRHDFEHVRKNLKALIADADTLVQAGSRARQALHPR